MSLLVESPTRILFFTGKGGVGKSSAACATAIALADAGKRVLLISTDPASNLPEILGARRSSTPAAVPSVTGLFALDIDPERAAHDYRERVVGPYRGVLPEVALRSIEEQLSGACTVEIAAFDELAKLLGAREATDAFDHVVFDTAPTGHTLRLLALPRAWTTFIDTNTAGTSCLGPLAGLAAQRELYAEAQRALGDRRQTTMVLVARPDASSLAEAERTRSELGELGITNVRLIVNGLFRARDARDPVATALEARGRAALDALPAGLSTLPRVEVPLLPFGLVGVDALRKLGTPSEEHVGPSATKCAISSGGQSLEVLVAELSERGRGVVMTMGKGGVGKTTIAARIAVGLARRGLPVTLTTTDPAAHVQDAVRELGFDAAKLHVTRIDPALETRRYTEEVLRVAGSALDAQGKALLEEDLRSPCTEEIAVFRAFAETVDRGEGQFVVIDTAPTGHTLLLLDAAESYHREVLKKPSGSPEAVRLLLPRLRDRSFTHILLVTLPEATPIHEAMQLERDLARAGISPLAWVVNQTLTPLAVTDPTLVARQAEEAKHLEELTAHGARLVIEPFAPAPR